MNVDFVTSFEGLCLLVFHRRAVTLVKVLKSCIWNNARMILTEENLSPRRKRVLVPLSPPQISHGLARVGHRVSTYFSFLHIKVQFVPHREHSVLQLENTNI